MRKFLVTILLLFVAPAFADSWDDFSNVDRMWDGQKSITNQEFEKVMEKLEENTKKKEEKQEAKRVRKIFGSGKLLHKDSNLDLDSMQNEVNVANSREDGVLINLPVKIYVENKFLDKGYYKIYAERNEETGKIYIKLYQSQYLMATVEVVETEDDYGQEKLDFAEVLPYNDSYVKLIFGSIDFNTYVLLPFSEE